MKTQIKILLSITVVLILSGLFFVLSLNMSGLTGAGLWFALALLALFAIVFSGIGLFKPKAYPIVDRRTHVLIILSAITTSVITFILTALNMAVYDIYAFTHEEKKLTVEEKVDVYIELVVKNRKSKQQLDEMESQNVGHITFYFTKEMDRQQLIGISIESIQSATDMYHNIFGNKVHEPPVKVVFYHDRNHLSNNQDRKTDGNLYSGEYHSSDQSIHIPIISTDVTPSEYRAILKHEYVHHLMHSQLEHFPLKNVPVWFEEGVASYMGNSSQELDESTDTFEFVSFEDLSTPGLWDKHLQDPYNPYLQSKLFFRYLITHEGRDNIQKLLEVTKSAEFDEVFKIVTGKSTNEYGDEFIKGMKEIPQLMKKVGHLELEKNWQGALAVLNQVLSIDPNHILAHHRMGNNYMAMGDFEKAKEYREAVLRLDPENSASYTYYAEALLFTGEIDAAIEHMQKAVEMRKTEPEGSAWSEGYLEHLLALKDNIQVGTPFIGYLDFIKSDYLPFDQYKKQLIDIALTSYPHVESVEKYKLIELKKELERNRLW